MRRVITRDFARRQRCTNASAVRPNGHAHAREVSPGYGAGRAVPKTGEARFEPTRAIRVRGAREHNLKGVDIDIPRDRLVVITGLSGSGKSSLAFDTIFAEGQRKYMESLSAYARQFLDQLKKPAIESIEGLPPTIAIEQRTTSASPRSTVATSTEIFDYLRLLFARVGSPVCWHPMQTRRDSAVIDRCGEPIKAANPTQIGQTVSQLPTGTRLMVLAPIVSGKKGHHKEVVEKLVKDGFARARVNGDVVDLHEVLQAATDDNPLKLGRYEKHDIAAVVDRLVVKANLRQRLAEAAQTALQVAGGTVIVTVQQGDKTWTDTVYSEHFSCALHPDSALEELEPRLFSFNAHQGACPTCHGLGAILEFDPELILPDPEKPIGKGGIAPWKKTGPGGRFTGKYIRRFCREFGVPMATPVGQLSDELRGILLYGTDEDEVARYDALWEGVIPILDDWWTRTESEWAKDFLHGFQTNRTCPDCFGARLNIKALSVHVETTAKAPLPSEVSDARRQHGLHADDHRMNIADFCMLNIQTALHVIDHLRLSKEQRTIAQPIVTEVKARLGFLASVGLEYLSLDRKTNTLSGGEAQRIRLATQVGSGIVGACYVLDEPTIGLHARDNDRLIRTLRHLADIGNTVLVVEHDEEMIRAADHLVDIGPGPGVHGGEVVAQGEIEDICGAPTSMTGRYLSGERSVPMPSKRRSMSAKQAIKVVDARANNLKGVDVVFPLGGLIAVTGVSGSGKSTLVNDILLQAAKKHVNGSRVKPGAHKRVNGLAKVDRIIEVDQSPIGRTPRSNPATYTGCFDDIRKLFAEMPDARARGYKPGRFSFNVKGGRCEACQGQGVKKVSMHFLPDVFVKCEVCEGARYNRETLEVTYRDKNIAEVLSMTVEDARTFFEAHPKIRRVAEALYNVGLGYLELGQTSTTLSGGEAQRVKLAAELSKGTASARSAQQHTLYILDEPTTGLHFEDVRKLVAVLEQLVDQGNTVVVIEHNLDVIKCADWLIDMGPEGGDGGGTVVAEGPPERVAKVRASHTGRYLKELLA